MVDVTTYGIESIDKVKHTDYDILLIDVNTPEMDGIEEIKKFNTSPPIIALMAVTQDEQEDRLKTQI